MTATETTRSTIPTTDELAELPPRVIAAFGARCARRALESAKNLHAAAVPEAIEKLEAIVVEIERFGAGGEPEAGLAVLLDEAFQMVGDYGEYSANPHTGEPVPGYVCIANVSDVLAWAIRSAREGYSTEAAKHPCSASLAARTVAGVDRDGRDNREAHNAAAEGIRQDADKLIEAARRLHWVGGTDGGTCVPASWFDTLSTGVRDEVEEG